MPNRQLSSSQAKTDYVSLPGSFFTSTLSGIQDLAELKTVLYVAYLVLRKQDQPIAFRHSEGEKRPKNLAQDESGGETFEAHGEPYFVTYNELLSQEPMAAMGEQTLRRALNSAVEHGTLLHSTSNINGVPEDVYSLPVSMYRGHQPEAVNIFALYEQNIGIITPMIAEELKEAEKLYPPRWIEEAFKEAAVLNKRSWKYIARILERWGSEGKDSGEYKGDAKKGSPDKYVRGKYGHLVKR